MKTEGLNYSDKNAIRKLLRDPQNFTHAQIAREVKCTVDLVDRFAGQAQEYQAPLGTVGTDDFGPLQGTKAWAALTPGDKAKITRKRKKAAEKAEPIEEDDDGNSDHDSIQPGAD